MRLENLTWPKASEYFKHNDTVLLAVGSIESHGRHLPLGTDTLIPAYILEKIDQDASVLIAPQIPYGACDYLTGFSGVISIGADLLEQLTEKILYGLFEHGARHFILLNGHGGNIKPLEQVALSLYKKGAVVAILNWWVIAGELNPAWKGGHGGAEETAAILAIDPHLVDNSELNAPFAMQLLTPKLENITPFAVRFQGATVSIPRMVHDVTDNGWFGPDHPASATQEWGSAMLDCFSHYVCAFIEEFKQVPLP